MATFKTPNLDLINILNTLNSWKIVIIGCETANDNLWKKLCFNNNMIYLSINDQYKLKYTIIKYLSLNSISRKNIGYLYAIHHGAKEIYEIDENIIISNLNENDIFNYTKIGYGIQNDYKKINPYAYFGEENIWPRGFSLSNIGKQKINHFYYLNYNQLILKPLVYQGIININPDLDLIASLTHIQNHFLFKKMDPILFFPGNYIPINSKNTKYLYDIFPFLALPVTINNKISDIFRGYILQRFLWGYNGYAIYYFSTAYCNKSNSINIANFFLEKDLYFQLDSFLEILEKQKSLEYNEPKNIFLNLIKCFVENGFLGEKDLEMYNAYLKDLTTIGYNNSFKFIKHINTNYKDFLKIYSEFKFYFPSKLSILIKNTSIQNSIKTINHFISEKKYDEILLIINYNHKGLRKLNHYIIKLYKQYFNNIIFLVPENINEKDIISCNNSYYGYYSYICLKNVYNKYPSFKGYLFINDDVFMKIWELENLDFNYPWIYNFHFIRKKWYHYKSCKGIYNVLNQHLEWKKNLTKFLGTFGIPIAISDFYYLPNYLMSIYSDIIEKMYTSKLFLECAVPTSFAIILSSKYQIIYFNGLWGEERKKVINYILKDYKQITIHPVKFSNIYLINEVNLYIYFINAKEY